MNFENLVPFLWILFALLSALSVAVVNIITKKLLSRIEEWLVFYAHYLFAALPGILLFFFIKIPKIQPDFYWAVGLASVLDVTGLGMMIRAISLGQLAKTFPLISFGPIFVILTSYAILKEVPTLLGMLGIVVIVGGAWILNFEKAERNFFKPLKRIINQKTSRYMLGTAFLFSFTAPLFKKAIMSSSVWFTMATSLILSTLILTLFFGIAGNKFYSKGSSPSGNFRKIFALSRRDLCLLIIAGLVVLLLMISICVAFELTLVAYAISVKRLSILFTIIFSYFFLGEKELSKNLMAGISMILGVFLIALG